MRRVLCADEISELGHFFFQYDRRGGLSMFIAIPVPRAASWVLSEWTIGLPNEYGAQWSWNGDADKPTLHPSLHAEGLWHGFVKDGMLIEA